MESVRQNLERNKSFPTRAVILAAGRGKRLRPFTDHTPKPLLLFNGRPTLDTILHALAYVGVTEVCLVTGHLGEQIETFVGSGAAWGMQASFCHQSTMCGTADALKTAESFLTSPSFVLAADYILPLDYLQPLQEIYLADGADMVVSLKQLPVGELASRSSVRFDENGRIVEIVEKPAPGTAPSTVGASLLYIVPSAIRHYLADLPLSGRNEYELPDVINRLLRDGYQMAGCVQSAPPEWQPPAPE